MEALCRYSDILSLYASFRVSTDEWPSLEFSSPQFLAKELPQNFY